MTYSNSLQRRREQALSPAYRNFYREPLELVRGAGVWVEDSAGRRYLDAYNNVPSVGHANPRVVDAIAQQASLINTNTRYLNRAVVDYAELLLAEFSSSLSTVTFTCTGSEANDLALRMAHTWHGGEGVVVTSNAYHGVTAAVAACSPSLGPVGSHVRTVVPPADNEKPEDFANRVAEAADELEKAGRGPVTLLVDTVMSSDGVHTGPEGALAQAAKIVRRNGGLFVADEVQGGFGRLGTMWGHEHHKVVPDIVTLGKPMGNGHPVGGVVSRRDIAESFSSDTRYFNTFGGNSVSAAAGAAVLREFAEHDLVQNAHRRGLQLRKELSGLQSQFPNLINGVRGAGLFVGLDMLTNSSPDMKSRLAEQVVDQMMHNGVLMGRCGRNGEVLKIRPPLIIEPNEIDIVVEKLAFVLDQLSERPQTE